MFGGFGENHNHIIIAFFVLKDFGPTTTYVISIAEKSGPVDFPVVHLAKVSRFHRILVHRTCKKKEKKSRVIRVINQSKTTQGQLLLCSIIFRRNDLRKSVFLDVVYMIITDTFSSHY